MNISARAVSDASAVAASQRTVRQRVCVGTSVSGCQLQSDGGPGGPIDHAGRPALSAARRHLRLLGGGCGRPAGSAGLRGFPRQFKKKSPAPLVNQARAASVFVASITRMLRLKAARHGDVGDARFLIGGSHGGKPRTAIEALGAALGMQLHLAVATGARCLHQRLQQLPPPLGAAHRPIDPVSLPSG